MACIAADKKITGLNPLLLLNSKVGIPLRKKIELSKMARISDGLLPAAAGSSKMDEM